MTDTRTSTSITTPDLYQAQHQHLQAATADNGRAWLAELRDRGMRHFAQVGFPTLKDEEWRYTSVKPIANTPFVRAQADQADHVNAGAVAPYLLELGGAVLVFVDGHYRQDLSDLSHLPAGTQVSSLAKTSEKQLRPHLGQYLAVDEDPFVALNTAFIDDGVFVQVDDQVVVEQPIHVLYLSSQSDQPLASHVRNLIVAGKGSQVTMVEHYVGLDNDSTYLSNAVTEIVVAANAHVRHYVIERESTRACNVSTLRVQQDRDSRFESHTALFGGALVRNNIHVELLGENCDSLVNGLFVGHGSQHMDNHMRVVHGAPHCDSRQFYKGVLDDQAHGVFSGRILVRKGAQKTDAKQTNRNLLLSEDAGIDTKPQLEIYADDVKCTHGATTGHLDKDALFYLQSRGIDPASAQSLLVFAFAHESLDRMTLRPVRNLLHDLLLERLAGERVREVLAQAIEA